MGPACRAYWNGEVKASAGGRACARESSPREAMAAPESGLILPNLFIPGAAKSGTSTLHDYLSRHPDIDMSVTKEPNYFWRTDKRLEHYANIFMHPERRYRGESSTNYMARPAVVERIRELVPDPRFIFIFRNPVDRAWSHYRWAKMHYGQERRDFRDAFENDLDRTPENGDRPPAINSGYYHFGSYARWLKIYLDAFGADRILVLVFEEFVTDPMRHLNEVYSFLGVQRIDRVEPIRSNTTNAVKFPALVWLYTRLARLAGVVVHDVLPSATYARLARLNHRLHWTLHRAMASEQNETLTDEERVWIAPYFQGEVERLRKLTGLGFAAWERDFPAPSHSG